MKIVSLSASDQGFLGKWGDPIQKELAQFKPVLNHYPQCSKAVEEVSLLADTVGMSNNNAVKERFLALNNNLQNNLKMLKLLSAGREYDKFERANSKPFVRSNYYTAKTAEDQFEKGFLDEIADITDKLAKLKAELVEKR